MSLEKMPKPQFKTGHLIHTNGPLRGFCETWKRWTPPKLADAGRKFEPKQYGPGAVVLFEHNGQRLKGQVWSEGPRRGTYWVVRDGEAYLV